MPINNEGICANCGNPWVSHYGSSCLPPNENPQGFRWDPIGSPSTTEERIGPVLVSRYPTTIRVEDARRVTVHHGYSAFVAQIVEDDRAYWTCCHFATGVSLSGHCTSSEEAVERADRQLRLYSKEAVDDLLKGYSIINKQPMKHRKVKVGDWVQIINSGKNWAEQMNAMADRIVQVTHVDYSEFNGQTICFEGSENFTWTERDGHFRLVNPSKVPVTRSLVFSKSMRGWLNEVRKESKIARIILACLELREDMGGWIVDKVLTGEEASFLTYRSNGNISFLPKGKECKYLDNRNWAPEGRQEGKPAKVMRKIFTPKALKLFKETDFEIFNNKFRSKFSIDGFEFKVFPANEIGNVYNMECHTETGALSDSCMRGDGHLMSIYIHCEQLKIVAIIHKETQKLAGRALLWDAYCPDKKETIKFLDRFYCTKDHLYEAFVDYASTNKLWYKKDYKSYQQKTLLINPETGLSEEVTMNVKTKLNFGCWPYIDTFSYSTDDTLTNVDDNTIYTYNCTNGCRTDVDGQEEGGDLHDGEVRDAISGEYIDEDESCRIERGSRRNQITHVENTVNIDGNSWWIHDDGICYSEYDGRYYEVNECVWSEHHNSYIAIDDAYEVANLGYFHKDAVSKC